MRELGQRETFPQRFIYARGNKASVPYLNAVFSAFCSKRGDYPFATAAEAVKAREGLVKSPG